MAKGDDRRKTFGMAQASRATGALAATLRVQNQRPYGATRRNKAGMVAQAPASAAHRPGIEA